MKRLVESRKRDQHPPVCLSVCLFCFAFLQARKLLFYSLFFYFFSFFRLEVEQEWPLSSVPSFPPSARFLEKLYNKRVCLTTVSTTFFPPRTRTPFLPRVFPSLYQTTHLLPSPRFSSVLFVYSDTACVQSRCPNLNLAKTNSACLFFFFFAFLFIVVHNFCFFWFLCTSLCVRASPIFPVYFLFFTRPVLRKKVF